MEDESRTNASSQRSTFAFDRVASAMACAMKAPMIQLGIQGPSSPPEKRERERERKLEIEEESGSSFLHSSRLVRTFIATKWWLQQKLTA